MGLEETRQEEAAEAADRRAPRRTAAQMLVVGLIASVLGVVAGLLINWFPPAASTQADRIDTLWDVLIMASVPVFVLVTVVIAFSIINFRMRPGEEGIDGPPIHGSTRLEVIWTAAPAIVIVALVTYAYIVLRDIEAAPASGGERVVQVFGEQFAWTFAYNEGGRRFRTAQLYLPANESVRFDVRSKDVIHDFWVPDFRMKIDAVPGITTRYRVTPTKLGDHAIVCAELCGLGHAFMRQTAHVLSADDFAAWVRKASAPAAGGGAAGGQAGGQVDAKQLFTAGKPATDAAPCGACHKLAAASTAGGVGPDLDKVLKGKDPAFIKESILKPDAEIAPGFGRGIMPPNYGDTLTPADVDALVKFLSEATK
ncbi:MAG: cytochrome c oxidase subunit [Solirubrobacteraceae bacterium]|jgi:cytochrome c oxidase subunit 2|nr:cytochrome c oxidase subunit [Solirubrobacteraceae bacterium]